MTVEIKWLDQDFYDKVVEKAKTIIKDRRGIYNDNWALMNLNSLLMAVVYKTDRALYTVNNPEKRLDDVLDAINYLVFAAARMLEAQR